MLRKAIDYFQILEEYNTLLIQQNRTLKKHLADSDKGELVNRFSSPIKRKLCDNNSRKATKCRKINIDSEPKKVSTKLSTSFVSQIYDLRSEIGREQHLRQIEQREALIQKHEATPTTYHEDAFPIKNARRSLDSIIEAINQLEGEERMGHSFADYQQ